MVNSAHGDDVSVILPHLSTAILPDAHRVFAGHPTGMELKRVLKRVESRLEAVGLSADAASKAAKAPDAIRNMRRAVKEGRKGVNSQTLDALAPVLKTTPAWLLTGEGPPMPGEHGSEPSVPVVGYVGAGAAAHFYAVSQGDLDDVPAPIGATMETVAVEVRGESLGPFFDRWLVFYDDVRSPVTDDLIGKLCVVGLPDDRVLVKKVKYARKKGLFQLISASTEETIDNVHVDWAARVKLMAPR